MRLVVGLVVGLTLGMVTTAHADWGLWDTTQKLLNETTETFQLGYVAGAIDGLNTSAQTFTTGPAYMREDLLRGARCLGNMQGTLAEIRGRIVSKLNALVMNQAYMGLAGAPTSMLYVACQP